MALQGIVIASGNAGKLQEIRDLLSARPVNVLPQSDFGIEDADETGLSFVENALIKARHASGRAGLPAIADDSGLEVDCLAGAPGIFSSRYAGIGASDEENLRLLLERLRSRAGQRIDARFQCVVVYMRHAADPTPLIAQAGWEGHIIDTPRGQNGFGYDPVFFVPEQGCTSAELRPEVKNSISHRGRAMQQLLEKLSGAL